MDGTPGKNCQFLIASSKQQSFSDPLGRLHKTPAKKQPDISKDHGDSNGSSTVTSNEFNMHTHSTNWLHVPENVTGFPAAGVYQQVAKDDQVSTHCLIDDGRVDVLVIGWLQAQAQSIYTSKLSRGGR